ncbi:MAG TPA: cation:proton antiporter [Trueperaceae bacterium]
MDIYMLVLTIVGLAFLGAAWVPRLVFSAPLSFPFLYVALGFLLFSLPIGLYLPNPLESSFFIERFTELLVIISLSGAGLKLARPPTLRNWGSTLRLLVVAMPLAIGAAALLGWWLLGLTPAAALLLGAVLAPTDPVLASDVQVGPPGDETEGETRFALTSEAGLNDGLAFPFTYLAIAAAAAASAGATGSGWIVDWAINDLLLKIGIGTFTGVALGLLLSKLVFRLPSTRGSISGEAFVVVAITLLAYGITELLHGYGFLAVFLAALTLRQQERDHPYHQQLHDFAGGLEVLLMSLMLILFGGLIAIGLLSGISWPMVLVAAAIVFLIRPVTALVSLTGMRLPGVERAAISFFGIRGVGSLYYLSYAFNRQEFSQTDILWKTVSLAIVMSIVVHGATASFAMSRVDDASGKSKEKTERLGEGD